MAAYCTCTVDEISAAGFSFRGGMAYCNHCGKPEVSSGPVKVPRQVSESEPIKSGNLVLDLFDFELERFVSVSYFKLLYAITVILWTIGATILFLYILANAQNVSGFVVFIFLLGIPIVYLLLLIYTRMSIEIIVNFFQIGKDLREIRNSKS